MKDDRGEVIPLTIEIPVYLFDRIMSETHRKLNDEELKELKEVLGDHIIKEIQDMDY